MERLDAMETYSFFHYNDSVLNAALPLVSDFDAMTIF
jgi:hypothetical protein